MNWRWASASEIGTSHIKNGVKLQDAYGVSAISSNCLFATVSDGAGSAEFGAFGAWISCRNLKVFFRNWFRENSEFPSDDILYVWIDEIRDELGHLAEARGCSRRQFAATLSLLVVTEKGALTMHIGDSCVAARRGKDWDVLCWPENGSYASTTYFITDDPAPRLNIQRFPNQYTAFALFSDGLSDVALSHQEKTASPKFFNPMIRPVDASQTTGLIRDLSAKLRSYLASSTICERTDDDKTLILISGA